MDYVRRCALFLLLATTGCYAPLEDDAWLFVVPPGVGPDGLGIPPPDEFDYLEGERLVVHAFFYYSGKLKNATCEIAVVGDTLTIHTSVKYKRHNDGALWHDSAVCQTEPMDAGTYTIVFDGRERTLTIPSTVEPPFFFVDEP